MTKRQAKYLSLPSHTYPTNSKALGDIPEPKPEQWRGWINAAIDYADANDIKGQDRDDWLNMVTGV